MREEKNFFDKCILKVVSTITKQEKVAFYSSLLAGLLAHGYMFVNKMINHDDMHYAFDVGKVIPSAYDSLRWALPAVSNFSGHWNTPWIISILSLVLLGMASIIIIRLGEIRSSTISAFIGVLFAVFPSVTGTYTYMFSLDAYLWAIVLTLLAALLIIRGGFLLNGIAFVMLIVSLAIYQAFIPFFYGGVFIYMLRDGLRGKINLKSSIILFVKAIVVSVLSLVAYLFLAKFFIVNVARADSVGVVSPKVLLNAIKDFGIDLVKFFFLNDYGVSTWYAAIATFFICLAFIIMLVLLKSTCNMDKYVVIFAIMGAVVSSLMLYIIDPGGYIHIIMKYPFVILPITSLVVLDSFLVYYKPINLKRVYVFLCILGISYSLLSWNYIIVANKTYYKMQMADKWVYGYSVRLIERIEQCDGYESSIPLCFIGAPKIEDDNQEISEILWGENRQITGALSPDYIFGEAATPYNCYEDYLKEYLGWNHVIYREYDRFAGSIPEADAVREKLSIYPSVNCMTVRDGILYVRFE